MVCTPFPRPSLLPFHPAQHDEPLLELSYLHDDTNIIIYNLNNLIAITSSHLCRFDSVRVLSTNMGLLLVAPR